MRAMMRVRRSIARSTRAIKLGHAQIIAEGPQLIFYALFNASLGASARISRCALDEPGGHTRFV
jgi:hypothetical protein